MTSTTSCRIVFWNIMHGGGSRADGIAEQILDWKPDIVAFAEFRGTRPSRSIAKKLFDAGYVHQQSTVNSSEPAWNALCLASRFELSRVCLEGAPEPNLCWLLAKARGQQNLHIGVILVPFDSPWYDYLDSLVKIAQDWQLGPGVIIGDTNCALTGLDEDTEYSADFKERFVTPLARHGWRDMFRAFYLQDNAPTWYSSSGNGFRLDHAYVSTELQPYVRSCVHDWGRAWEGKKLSDHAAILLDLDLGATYPLT